MSMSKIIISGKVIRQPEKRFTPSTNMAVTEFTVQVESQPRGDQALETSPVKVFTWRDLAERCAQEIKKGDMVIVDGRMQINNYTTSDGQKRRDVEIDAIAVENISTIGSSAHLQSNNEQVFAYSQARSTTTAHQLKKSDDLDIFASEDEIPF